MTVCMKIHVCGGWVSCWDQVLWPTSQLSIKNDIKIITITEIQKRSYSTQSRPKMAFMWTCCLENTQYWHDFILVQTNTHTPSVVPPPLHLFKAGQRMTNQLRHWHPICQQNDGSSHQYPSCHSSSTTLGFWCLLFALVQNVFVPW